jgi:hypothetical protein
MDSSAILHEEVTKKRMANTLAEGHRGSMEKVVATLTDITPEHKMLILDAFVDECMEPGSGIFSAGFDGSILVVTLKEGADVDVPRRYHDCDVRVERHGRGAKTLPRRIAD